MTYKENYQDPFYTEPQWNYHKFKKRQRKRSKKWRAKKK